MSFILTIHIIWMILKNFLIELFCLVELAEHFMKTCSVILDGNRNGGVVLWILVLFSITAFPGFLKVLLCFFIIAESIEIQKFISSMYTFFSKPQEYGQIAEKIYFTFFIYGTLK